MIPLKRKAFDGAKIPYGLRAVAIVSFDDATGSVHIRKRQKPENIQTMKYLVSYVSFLSDGGHLTNAMEIELERYKPDPLSSAIPNTMRSKTSADILTEIYEHLPKTALLLSVSRIDNLV